MGNVAKGFHLPSLIRAYNGPNFVVEDGTNLPYSPDYLVISATLQNITNPTKLEVKDAHDQAVASISSGMAVYTGYTVKTTDLTSTVDLYFSDGSVTHLDGSTELKIQSGSEVAENGKDNIITKIRLKLFSGKIWNKVARLAARSEFNVETTSAIAGVRGTEFGADANDEFLVYSGSICPNEGNTCDVADALTGTPTSPQMKNLHTKAALTLDENPGLNTLMGEQTQHYLNDNMSPHILKVDGLNVTIQNPNTYYGVEGIVMDESNNIEVSANGETAVTTQTTDADGNYVINFTSSLSDVIFRFKDSSNPNNILYSGYSTPPINVSEGTLITEADLYGLEGEVAGVGGMALVSPGCQIILNNPPDNPPAFSEGSTIYLSWYMMPAGCAGTFDLYLNSELNPAGITDYNYQVSSLTPKEYTWQIKSGSIESETRLFTIAATPICTADTPNYLTCEIKDTAMNTIGYGMKTITCACAPTCFWPSWDTVACIASSCNLDYKVDGGTCKACTDFGSKPDNSQWVNNCEWQCISGYHSTGTSCVADDECTYSLTTNPTQNQTCGVTNGTGGQTRACTTTNVWGDWSTCSVQSCNDGYQILGNSCNPTLQTSCIGLTGFTPVTDGTATIGYKNTTMGTYYSLADNSCWVLGDSGQSCDTACPAKLGSGAVCATGDWNDTNTTACTNLTNGTANNSGDLGYAPYYFEYLLTKKCYSRGSYTYLTGETLCNMTPSGTGVKKRICKCQ